MLALILIAGGCSSGPDPLVVGAVYPLSGSQGPGGIEEHRGVLLAAQLANEAGGVAGRLVEIRSIDVSGSDAAPAAIERLADEGIRFVLGSYGSTISRPAAEESARRGLLFWETGAVGEMSEAGAGRLAFRVAPTGSVLGRSAVAFIADQLSPLLDRSAGGLRFAVANVSDVYGAAVARGAVEEIAERALPFAGQFEYDVTTVDYPHLVRRIAAAKPDVLFVSAYLEDAVALREETVRQRVPLLASIGTSSSYCHPEFGERLGVDALGLFASDKPDAGSLNPEGLTPNARSLLARAEARYRKAYGEPMDAPALAGFSAAWALFRAVMPAADALSPEAVSAAALAADLPPGELPNGSGLSFAGPGTEDAGANLRAASVIWEWVRPGVRAIVWPPHYATHEVQPIAIAP